MNKIIFILSLLVGHALECLPYDPKPFSQMLFEASSPSEEIKQLLSAYPYLPPDIKLAACFTYVLKNWKYVSDIVDAPTAAEKLIKAENFSGDCDDLSSLLCSIARSLGLNAYQCVGYLYSDPCSGHAWCEVEVCPVNEFDTALKERLEKYFGLSDGFVTRNGLVFIILDYNPIDNKKQYKLDYRVRYDGKVFD